MYDNDDMTELEVSEQLKRIEKAQRSAKYENKKEERETGLDYKLLKSE